MKKFFVSGLIFILIIVLITIITINKREVTNNMNDMKNGLSISTIEPERINIFKGVFLKNIEYDTDKKIIRFKILNNTSDTIYYGEQIILEKKQNGKWYEVPYSNEVGFTDILNYLQPLTEEEIGITTRAWIPITTGEYRIIKKIFIEENSKQHSYISINFTIQN